MPDANEGGLWGPDAATLRRIVENVVDYAIFTLDPDRSITGWSAGARAIFGFADEEVIGRPADLIFTPEDRQAGVPEQEAATARRDGRASDERWHIRKDGTRFFASGVLTSLGGEGAGFVKILRDLTDRKLMEDALRRSRDELESRVAARTAELSAANARLRGEMAARDGLRRRLSRAQEEERLRLARELHDSAGQALAVLSMSIESLARSTPLPPSAMEILARVRRSVDELSRELHGISVRLRPTALDDLGLVPALRQLAEEWSSRAGVAVELTTANIDARLAEEVETALYRIAQEALTNVARHARASRVSIVLSRPDAQVALVVEDDGVGFDAATSGAGRLGLAGMRERVGLIGGTLELESSPGGGTTIVACVPIAGVTARGGTPSGD